MGALTDTAPGGLSLTPRGLFENDVDTHNTSAGGSQTRSDSTSASPRDLQDGISQPKPRRTLFGWLTPSKSTSASGVPDTIVPVVEPSASVAARDRRSSEDLGRRRSKLSFFKKPTADEAQFAAAGVITGAGTDGRGGRDATASAPEHTLVPVCPEPKVRPALTSCLLPLGGGAHCKQATVRLLLVSYPLEGPPSMCVCVSLSLAVCLTVDTQQHEAEAVQVKRAGWSRWSRHKSASSDDLRRLHKLADAPSLDVDEPPSDVPHRQAQSVGGEQPPAAPKGKHKRTQSWSWFRVRSAANLSHRWRACAPRSNQMSTVCHASRSPSPQCRSHEPIALRQSLSGRCYGPRTLF